ncbi:MAG: hypothetical protein GWN53_17030 [Gammaproteobacteria bacterium]|uniref:Uncharacterized protein n=1 Tax=Candidatus Kutchimonas denitrificans TaxID=3056748 RepID=A0AAE4ZD67_9BACT|nr:hypothetical protein [Candidatus Kutchimonas denitrificans]NIV53545.1 hypothetical protein [Gammaproteobacteria bacterium]
MEVQFATCVRPKALEYIQKVYPSKEITDTEDSAGPLLDLVEAGVVRVQDPTMYGNRIGIIPGKNWDDSRRGEVTKAAALFTG